jgi:dipeptidyl aminopeptidase/acylaminoacyl peptidase
VNCKYSVLVVLAALAVLPACKKTEEAGPTGLGKTVAEGPARGVLPSPDGGHLAFIADPKPARELGQGDLPPNIWMGTARIVPTSGGAPVTLGRNVTTLPSAMIWDPAGTRLLALTEFQFKTQEGTLVVGETASGEVRTLAPKVSFFGFSPDGKRLAYVSGDTLFVGPADGSAPAESLGTASTFEFSPDGQRILFRRALARDGSLLLAEVGAPGAAKAEPRVISKGVADYDWSPAGDRVAYTARNPDGSVDLFVAAVDGAPPKNLGNGVPTFAFSADGKHLAFVVGVSPAEQYGNLMVLAAGAEKPAKLGEKVSEWAFDPASQRLGWIEKYQPTGRVGTLAYARVAAEPKPKRLGDDVMSFRWSRTGDFLAYQQRTLRPVFSVDLFLEKVGGEAAPQKVASGVFGYDFGRDDETVIFRHQCVREGRECVLASLPTEKLGTEPKRLAGGVFTFEFNKSLEDLMLTYARMDAEALDVSVMPADGSRPPVVLDQTVAHGTKWAGNDRIAYASLAYKRQGLYVADVATLPAPPAATR